MDLCNLLAACINWRVQPNEPGGFFSGSLCAWADREDLAEEELGKAARCSREVYRISARIRGWAWAR